MYSFANNKLLNYSFLAIVALIAALAFGSFAFGQVPPEPPVPPLPPGSSFVAGEVLLSVFAGTPAAAIDGLVRVQNAVAGVTPPALEGLGVKVLNVAPGREIQVSAALSRSPLVDFAEPNYIYQLHSLNDPDFGKQWSLDNANDADVDWLEAYNAFPGGTFSQTIIAVIDTGIDPNHPDFLDKIMLPIVDFIGGDGKDTYGHGTHVSGIAAAVTNNTEGIAGVAFSGAIEIMSIRAGDENGLPVSAIVSGIVYAADNGARVINMSFGGSFSSSTIQSAVDYAWDEKGVVLVASAGNDGNPRKQYPAAYDDVMAVSATSDTDSLAYYSSKGDWLSVAAPGGEMSSYHDPGGIYSTMPTYDVYLTTELSYFNFYDYLQGTSMSSPIVAGLAGLLFAQDPTRTNDEVRSIIETTADDLGASGFDKKFGHGRINVYNALKVSSPPSSTTGSIEGTVTNADGGDPIEGATVSVDTGQSAVTGSDGIYTIVDVPTGDRSVTASADGFASETKTSITVTDGGTATVDFALNPILVGSITGTVTNADGGDLIEGATVSVDTGQSAVTGSDGTYGITDVLTGDRSVTASADGFESQIKSATVTDGGTTIVDFALVAVSTATTVSVSFITYAGEGGKNNDKHLLITVALVDDPGDSVEGASVSIDLFRDENLVGQGTGATGTGGTVTFSLKNAPDGCYTTTVTAVVTADGLDWDGGTPENSFGKGGATCPTSSPAPPAYVISRPIVEGAVVELRLVTLPVMKVERTALRQNYPNPFNPETWIPFELSDAERVVVKIYSATGGLVRTLDLGQKAPGAYINKGRSAYWDGRNASGEQVTSGIYFYTMEAGSFRAINKMIVLK